MSPKLNIGGCNVAGGQVPYSQYLKDFVLTPLGTILAANALDGSNVGLHGLGLSRDLLEEAYVAGGSLPGLSHVEFFRLMEDLSLGRMPSATSYLDHWSDDMSEFATDNTVSIVWPFGVLDRLASAEDLQRFADVSGVMKAPGTDWIAALAGLPHDQRYFRPAPRASFGQAFVWVTSTAMIGPHLDAAATAALTAADVCRDVLGLIHHQPATPQKTLVALHIPMSLVTRKLTGRPCFVEANSHARFSLRAREPGVPPDAPSGRTIDLKRLADGEGLRNGLVERVMLSFSGDEFEVGEVVGFDVLGAVTAARGQLTGGDDTPAFADLVRDGRTPKTLLDAVLAP